MKTVRLPRSFTVTASGTVGEVSRVDETFIENTKKIILAAAHIESQLERIIMRFLFPQANEQQSLFEAAILTAEFFTMSAKRRVFLAILANFDAISGAERSEIDRLLARVIRYRNAFTHGRVSYGKAYEATLSYFEGAPRTAVITDDYLTTLETDILSCFTVIDELAVKAGLYPAPKTMTMPSA
ncbi:MAG TPA: hypothetical protein VJU77_15095 [Chthoniobacterales bacterium]|nr:hypothetical protein [Chthoniobacterales bacterium]